MTCKDCIHYEICTLWATKDLDDDKAYERCGLKNIIIKLRILNNG